jgi:hypothetical protein
MVPASCLSWTRCGDTFALIVNYGFADKFQSCDLVGYANDLTYQITGYDNYSLTYRFDATTFNVCQIFQDNFDVFGAVRVSSIVVVYVSILIIQTLNTVIIYAENSTGGATCLDWWQNQPSPYAIAPSTKLLLPVSVRFSKNDVFNQSLVPTALQTATALIVKFVHTLGFFSPPTFDASGTSPPPRIFSDCRVDPTSTTSCSSTLSCEQNTCGANGVCQSTSATGASCVTVDPWYKNNVCQADGTCAGTVIAGSRAAPFVVKSLPVINQLFSSPFGAFAARGAPYMWCDNEEYEDLRAMLFVQVDLANFVNVTCVAGTFELNYPSMLLVSWLVTVLIDSSPGTWYRCLW